MPTPAPLPDIDPVQALVLQRRLRAITEGMGLRSRLRRPICAGLSDVRRGSMLSSGEGLFSAYPGLP
ncbi:MAG: hypothetical protein QF636_00370 [Arenicellales bacterium]|nr:hypothetical protein [Arenicellales bacterium]MDP6290375.1 hypothetical protein [Arenicellales bacterium]